MKLIKISGIVVLASFFIYSCGTTQKPNTINTEQSELKSVLDSIKELNTNIIETQNLQTETIKKIDIFFDSKGEFIERSKNILPKLYEMLDTNNLVKFEILSYSYNNLKFKNSSASNLEKLKSHIERKFPYLSSYISSTKPEIEALKYHSSKDNRVEVIIYQKTHQKPLSTSQN